MTSRIKLFLLAVPLLAFSTLPITAQMRGGGGGGGHAAAGGGRGMVAHGPIAPMGRGANFGGHAVTGVVGTFGPVTIGARTHFPNNHNGRNNPWWVWSPGWGWGWSPWGWNSWGWSPWGWNTWGNSWGWGWGSDPGPGYSGSGYGAGPYDSDYYGGQDPRMMAQQQPPPDYSAGPTVFEHDWRPSGAPYGPGPVAQPSAEQPQAQERTEWPSTVLVFRDGHQQEVSSYAIAGSKLVVVTGERTQKIQLSDLDLNATAKANNERGVEFKLPNQS